MVVQRFDKLPTTNRKGSTKDPLLRGASTTGVGSTPGQAKQVSESEYRDMQNSPGISLKPPIRLARLKAT